MEKSYITIQYNRESFYGDSSDRDIANINHAAATAEYQRQIIAGIRKHYSADELEISFEYNAPSSKFLLIETDDPKTKQEIYDLVYEIVEQVYNRGTFWLEK